MFKGTFHFQAKLICFDVVKVFFSKYFSFIDIWRFDKWVWFVVLAWSLPATTVLQIGSLGGHVSS